MGDRRDSSFVRSHESEEPGVIRQLPLMEGNEGLKLAARAAKKSAHALDLGPGFRAKKKRAIPIEAGPGPINACAGVGTAIETSSVNWQCTPKARIISGGGIHPDSCRLVR